MRLKFTILTLAIVSVAAACGGSGGDTTGPTSSGNPPQTPTTPSAPATTNAVTVSDNQFTPSSIQVARGTTVTWTWASGSVVHNVTFTDGISSGDKGANSTFSRTFATAGTFNYACTIHGGMQGSVLVQ